MIAHCVYKPSVVTDPATVASDFPLRPLRRICNPTQLNIRICNPQNQYPLASDLQLLQSVAADLQSDAVDYKDL